MISFQIFFFSFLFIISTCIAKSKCKGRRRLCECEIHSDNRLPFMSTRKKNDITKSYFILYIIVHSDLCQQRGCAFYFFILLIYFLLAEVIFFISLFLYSMTERIIFPENRRICTLRNFNMTHNKPFLFTNYKDWQIDILEKRNLAWHKDISKWPPIQVLFLYLWGLARVSLQFWMSW